MSRLTNKELQKYIDAGFSAAIKEIGSYFGMIQESIVPAGQLIQAAQITFGVDKVYKALSSKLGMPRAIVNNFVRAAAGTLDLRLALQNGRAYSRLAQYPLAVQKEALDKGVQMLVNVDKGSHLMVEVGNMSCNQVEQCLGREGVRDLGAQRAWIENNRRRRELAAIIRSSASAPQKQAKAKSPYSITKGVLRINVPNLEFTSIQLMELATKVAKSAAKTTAAK